jgi:[phosphatase 2A protein]-leucine-carboxy methyltransferase
MKNKYPQISLNYHEFDFPVNTAAKIKQMRTPPFIQSASRLCGVDLLSGGNEPSSPGDDEGDKPFILQADRAQYHLHAMDLRTLTSPKRQREQIEEELVGLGVSLNIPTLLLSECCLIYLSPEDADSVLSYFTSPFQNRHHQHDQHHHSATAAIGVIIYEPIRPHDPFGRTMVANLTARGIHLQTLNAHDSLAAQRQRLKTHGYETAQQAVDVDFLWQTWIDEPEKERVGNLEWMDEVEEFRLLARHYCVAWGWKEATSSSSPSTSSSPDEVRDAVFSSWTGLAVQDVDE